MQLRVVRIGNVSYGKLPADWVRENGIEKGDFLHFIETPDGQLVISPKRDGNED